MTDDQTTVRDMKTRERLRSEFREEFKELDGDMDALRERIVALETKTQAQADQISTLFQLHNDAAPAGKPRITRGQAAAGTGTAVAGGAGFVYFPEILEFLKALLARGGG